MTSDLKISKRFDRGCRQCNREHEEDMRHRLDRIEDLLTCTKRGALDEGAYRSRRQTPAGLEEPDSHHGKVQCKILFLDLLAALWWPRLVFVADWANIKCWHTRRTCRKKWSSEMLSCGMGTAGKCFRW